MTKRMLIDATHAEETRVVVMDGNRLEDYDVEAANRKQLKGNIYLAKVIRVEPSLQAAFVEYGGNRHGFLAFSEIHPDYYQIPVADREKLLAIQEEEAALEEERAEQAIEADSTADSSDGGEGEAQAASGGADEESDGQNSQTPDYVGGETDTGEEDMVQKRMARFLRNYKIQEVIRRRQILLVQVVKEERGNKGAALTSYISLAGRYCVLMPNALRGGGVSRKITSVADRKRLRDIIADLQLPRGMAMIVRTAGAQRPRPEVTKDCEYLLHLWDQIREHTINSVAPALIYEEASLVKRAIRDVYTRDIDEILVDGEPGWRSARDFMRMLMPQSAPKVKLWRKENQPLFSHYHVEGQLDGMLSPTVQLRSGGYLVINQTEALVAIDVNSGRATRERNIEETAVKTNLEAADEVARQLRLRDLAGLIVIDFIDMEARRHNAQVERRLKDALRHDRARIQVGGISHFGLLEMSRQRLRPSVAESAFMSCPHCQGTGIVRGIESSALHVLRAIEDEGGQRRAAEIAVYVAGEIALYILNNKRDWLTAIETRHKMHVVFAADAGLPAPEIRIERRRAQTAVFDTPASEGEDALLPVEEDQQVLVADEPSAEPKPSRSRSIAISDTPPVEAAPVGQVSHPDGADETPEEDRTEEETPTRRRRRRRRRRGSREETAGNAQVAASDDADETVAPKIEARAEGKQQAVGKDVAADGENLVPGRARTRYSRKNGTGAPRQNRAGEERAPVAPVAAPVPAPPKWRGPTPADPFGGSFDIFDMMEQEEFASSATPPKVPVVAEKKEEQQPVVSAEAHAEEQVTHDVATKEPRAGRRRRSRRDAPRTEAVMETPEVTVAAEEIVAVPESEPVAAVVDEEKKAPARGRRRSPRRKPAETNDGEVATVTATEAEAEVPAAVKEAVAVKPKSTRKPAVVVKPTVIDDETPAAKPRTGWWRK
ncbi:Rne/Rng family ribonuclease [Acetobacter conturbans]|uniref:Ribonuclease E n=1 Tax=Acetobacter conturbans TaxID=1737472 RepID=A0ABX0K143_9PROT|nr:ribonuclease E/G [Acetobacter conturbans]NHN88536.1 Rne/Rng family ribonuclease [Acetobacter conturbans]